MIELHLGPEVQAMVGRRLCRACLEGADSRADLMHVNCGLGSPRSQLARGRQGLPRLFCHERRS